MSEVTTTYCGVAISYAEREDKWVFELLGRERKCDTLTKAKEAINAPPPKNKKPFTRMQAIKAKFSGSPSRVEITSLAEAPAYSRNSYVWIVENGQRQKEDVSYLYAASPANEEKVTAYLAREKQIEALEKANRELISTLDRIDLSGIDGAE